MATSTVLVFGATGNVGHGAAAAFLAEGARVIAPTRSAASAARLAETFAGHDLHPVVGDVADADDVGRLHDAIAHDHGAIDHVVVSLGPWWQGGEVAGQPPSEWTSVRAMLLDGHVHAAATWLPDLAAREGSSYTVITGMAAHHPMPGTSLLYVAVRGVVALSEVLRRAHARDRVRVNELLIACRVEKAPRSGVVPSAVFGRALTAIAASDVRGQVLRYDSPDTFSVDRPRGAA